MPIPMKRKRESRTAAIHGPMISINVGEKTFHAPWGVLAHYSTFFSGLMNSGFQESETHTITLEDTDEITFEAFLSWVYFGQLYDEKTIETDPISGNHETRTSVNLTQLQLCKLWVFADMRGAPKLQNKVLRQLKKHIDETWLLDEEAVSFCYENTTANSNLRAFWIDFSALHYGWDKVSPFMQAKENRQEHKVEFPPEFVLDSCSRLRDFVVRGKKSASSQEGWKAYNIRRYMVPEDAASEQKK